MPKYINIAIVVSFFCLWLNSFLSKEIATIIGFLLIFTFGIFHGANDLILIKSINISKNNYSFVSILTYYLIIILIGVSIFVFFPVFALILFILVSSYHFGEQQLQYLEILDNYLLMIITDFFYGILILLLLFNCHQFEVSEIIFEISSFRLPTNIISLSLNVFFVSLFLVFLYLYINNKTIRTKLLLEVFYLLVFQIIFMSSGLIWGFAIFFIIWHSIPSILDQVTFLYKEISFRNFKKYFKSAFWYWIISLLGILLLFLFFKNEKIFNALFFSFLAAITFPHALVILKMFQKK